MTKNETRITQILYKIRFKIFMEKLQNLRHLTKPKSKITKNKKPTASFEKTSFTKTFVQGKIFNFDSFCIKFYYSTNKKGKHINF